MARILISGVLNLTYFDRLRPTDRRTSQRFAWQVTALHLGREARWLDVDDEENARVNFAYPRVLWFGAVLLPLLGLFLWFTWRKRQEVIRQFVQNKVLAQLTFGVSAARQKLRRLVLFVAVGCFLLGMAGPQWGFTWEEAAQRGRDILVAIDTSRSMLATDVQPNRLARAKLAALDLLRLGKFDRFGLIAFSGSAFLQCPLTFDDEAFRQSVQILEPGIIPQGGTALSEAIRTAREAFGTDAEENHKVLILFTDGEDHEEQVTETVERAASEGLRIFTVGVGTPGGELLRALDEQGKLSYVKDEAGNVVKSRLNEQLLQQVATTGNGFYLPLQGGNAMDILYQRGLAPLPTSERASKLMKKLREQFYWPLGIGILLLIIEVFLPDQKRQARKVTVSAEAGKVPSQTVSAVAAVLLLAFVPNSEASAAKAQRHYKAGEYKSALSEYQKLIERAPDDSRLRYNAGAAAYQAEKFDEAVKQFQAAVGANDLDLRQQSHYNLGNSHFKVGLPEPDDIKIASWENALKHYDEAIRLSPHDEDARTNRELVAKELEKIKKQQKNQSDQQNQNNENKDDSKDQKDQQKDEQKDNKSEQQKQEEQKNNQSEKNQQQQNQEEDKQDEQQKKQQRQQSEADQQKQDGKEKQEQAQKQQSGQQNADGQKPEGEEEAGQLAQLGKMTPAQAKQLLDAQKTEEKALLFLPQQQERKNSQNRSFKDW